MNWGKDKQSQFDFFQNILIIYLSPDLNLLNNYTN